MFTMVQSENEKCWGWCCCCVSFLLRDLRGVHFGYQNIIHLWLDFFQLALLVNFILDCKMYSDHWSGLLQAGCHPFYQTIGTEALETYFCGLWCIRLLFSELLSASSRALQHRHSCLWPSALRNRFEINRCRLQLIEAQRENTRTKKTRERKRSDRRRPTHRRLERCVVHRGVCVIVDWLTAWTQYSDNGLFQPAVDGCCGSSVFTSISLSFGGQLRVIGLQYTPSVLCCRIDNVYCTRSVAGNQCCFIFSM